MIKPIARFSFWSNELNKEKEKPNTKLFKLPKNKRLSVARVEDLNHEEIQKLGKAFGRKRTDNRKYLFGWGVFSMEDLRRIGLIIKNDDPPCRHSEISGWFCIRDKRKRQVQELIRVSQAIILEPPLAFSNSV